MSSSEFSDAHVHLFNASDLPLAGYMRYVFLPEYLPGAPDLVLALVDIALNVSKSFAPSIRQERRKLGLSIDKFSNAIEPPEVNSSEKLAGGITRHINERLQLITDTNPDISLMDAGAIITNDEDLSYIRLAVLLASEPFEGGKIKIQNNDSKSPLINQTLQVKLGTIKRLMNGDYVLSENTLLDTSDYASLMFGTKNVSSFNLTQVFVWIGKMFQYRTRHLKDYRDEIRSEKLEASKLINLLVDYDAWLRNPYDVNQSDGPAKDSSHNDQIEFWHDLKQNENLPVEVLSFAGYDPLKHAKELKETGASEYFDKLKDYAQSNYIQGFKLYPPMGFRSYDNASLNQVNNNDFVGENGIKDAVVRWWGKTPSLGVSLDETLNSFYTFTTKNDIPLMIHTKLSNFTAKNFAERASPKHIVIATLPQNFPNLRACLGHFTEAKNFIKAMNAKGTQKRPMVPAIEFSSKLFTPATPNIYADIGHMHDLIGQSDDFVKEFFEAVLKYCNCFPEACNRLMFGSDWIMLAKEKNYKSYVGVIEKGLESALTSRTKNDFSDFPEKFFRKNFENFMKLEPKICGGV